MKKPARLFAILGVMFVSALSSCTYNYPQPQELHYHHYRTSTSYNKSSSVSGGVSSSAPEGFQAVTPPHSYSN